MEYTIKICRYCRGLARWEARDRLSQGYFCANHADKDKHNEGFHGYLLAQDVVDLEVRGAGGFDIKLSEIEPYTQHKPGCSHWISFTARRELGLSGCSCGLDAALGLAPVDSHHDGANIVDTNPDQGDQDVHAGSGPRAGLAGEAG